MTSNKISTDEERTEAWKSYVKLFGLNLQRIRQSRHYSQERVAYDACLSKTQYQRLENGGFTYDPPSNPTAKTLLALCQVLSVGIEELFPEPWPDLRNK